MGRKVHIYGEVIKCTGEVQKNSGTSNPIKKSESEKVSLADYMMRNQPWRHRAGSGRCPEILDRVSCNGHVSRLSLQRQFLATTGLGVILGGLRQPGRAAAE